MAPRTVRGLFALGSLVVVASCVWLARGAADIGEDHRRVARVARRETQMARFARLRSAVRHLTQKESKKEKEERRRFQSIVSSVLGDTPGIVVDVWKLRNTRIGDRVLACLANTQRPSLDRAKNKWGVDLLSDVKRIAFAKEFVLIAGQVASLEKAGGPADISWESYGGQGKVFDSERATGSGRPNAGLWGNELFMVSRDLDDIYDAIDVAEGWETETDGFTHSNGVVYGTVEPGELVRLLDVSGYLESVIPLLDKLVRRVTFELLVHQGVLVKTELTLYRKETTDILIIGLEGLRDILVRKSDAFGYFELSELIDAVSITDRGGSVFLEWEMPLGFVKRELSRCSG